MHVISPAVVDLLHHQGDGVGHRAHVPWGGVNRWSRSAVLSSSVFMRAVLFALARLVTHRATFIITFLAVMFAWKVAAKAIVTGYGWRGFVITLALMFALGFLVERRFP